MVRPLPVRSVSVISPLPVRQESVLCPSRICGVYADTLTWLGALFPKLYDLDEPLLVIEPLSARLATVK